MNEWIDELSDLAAAGEPAVLVTVAGIRGSAPREIGAKMIVTATETIGTIGGGQLEYQSTRVAVDMLTDTTVALPLGGKDLRHRLTHGADVLGHQHRDKRHCTQAHHQQQRRPAQRGAVFLKLPEQQGEQRLRLRHHTHLQR